MSATEQPRVADQRNQGDFVEQNEQESPTHLYNSFSRWQLTGSVGRHHQTPQCATTVSYTHLDVYKRQA